MLFKTTRLKTLEEKSNTKKAFIYVLLTVGLMVLFLFLGIPALTKLAGFLGDFKKGGQAIEKNDTTPPAPPKLDSLPEFTNQPNLEIKGVSESGATLNLFINDTTESVVADKQGLFTFSTQLQKGKNTISVLSKDASGNESLASDTVAVTFDDKAPELEITSPADGASFYGSLQRQVVIEGKTEEGGSVYINDRMVIVEDDGTFNYASTLEEGDNNFNLKAQDRAGNETVKGITLHFWK